MSRVRRKGQYGGNDLTEIKIGYNVSENFHIISVCDDGLGIGMDNSDKIFNKFQRYETSIGIEGAGLGLAIVKNIAEQHGGKAWVVPSMAKGKIFHLSISKYL